MIKVDCYVMVHNEAVLLPYFLRHYETFCQRIFAFEDQSTDGSREILEAHPKVTIIEPEKHGINEGYWINELWPMYEQLSRGSADYVIQVDADEFVHHMDPLWALARQKHMGSKIIFCRGYTMISEKPPTTSGQIYDEIQMGIYDKLSCKCAIFDPEIRLRYSGGRHTVKEWSNGTKIYKTGFRIFHYRFLGGKYFEDRNIRNQERGNITREVPIPYSVDLKLRCPDWKRGGRLKWYLEHKHEAVNILRG